MRPVVIAMTFVGAAWSFIWGGSALYDIGQSSTIGDIRTINLVLGILFLVAGFIETFGFFAAIKQQISLVRMYSYLSIVVTLILIGAEGLRFSVYFTHKKSILSSCTQLETGNDQVYYGGFWGSFSYQNLTQPQAQQYCQDAWTRGVWSSVIWLIVSILLSVLYVSIAFSFYHQLLSPQPLAPSQAYTMDNLQQQPYHPQSGYQYPAPPGLPPSREDYVPPYDPAKVPEYYENEAPFEKPKEKGYGAGAKSDFEDV